MPGTTQDLREYRRKRDFRRTDEPRGGDGRPGREGRSFCVQKHDARRLHYDFRLEIGGVLKSWAVPKGPSFDPAERRLAVPTEDHPLEYGSFEGIIPRGEYGGGTVMLWDRGTYRTEGDAAEAYARGRLRVELEGEKLRGGFTLVRTKGGDQWLLMKRKDAFARPGVDVSDLDFSVKTGRPLDEIAHVGEPAPMPAFIAPELATLVEAPPAGDGWLHEIKLDGYRLLAHVEGARARLYSRNGHEWTAKLPQLAKELAPLPDGYYDGEAVVFDAQGRSHFASVVDAIHGRSPGPIVYCIFDLLFLDGRDLRREPLTQRKAALVQLLRPMGSAALRYGDHVRGEGQAFFEAACAHALEGVVSKRADAPYRSGRGRQWRKVRCHRSQEMVIVGFTPHSRGRDQLGALLLGVHEDEGGRLRYAGKVGTGFREEDRRRLRALLEKQVRETPPVDPAPTGREAAGARWVAPSRVAEVAFTEWTSDGRLRHPVFLGLREDKPAREVVRERPREARGDERAPAAGTRRGVRAGTERAEAGGGRVGTAGGSAQPKGRGAQGRAPLVVCGVRLSNPDKELYPARKLTKADLARHYERVAQRMVPHVDSRPLSLVRCPNGQHTQCWFQKHPTGSLPEAVSRVAIREKENKSDYLVVHDAKGLVSLAQMGALEVHVWGSRSDRMERPDRVVFDLDPAPEVAFGEVVEAARILRTMLHELWLGSFVMVTGGKGLHVVVPIARHHEFGQVKAFSRGVARMLAKNMPTRFVATASKKARTGKIFVDYLRNGRGATAICPYSTRAHPSASVAVPVSWEELDALPGGDAFTITEMDERLAQADPWASYGQTHPRIRKRALEAMGATEE